jgi:putative ABC transport system permease protein
VVGNSRHDSLAAPPGPEMYVPLPQDPTRSLDVVIRVASTNLIGLQADVKRAVHEVDKDLFVPQLQPMTSLLTTQLAQPRFNMLLLAVFAGVAMVLAAIGIYGVISYSVTQRTREIGIRMALGAQKTQMLGMVLRQSLTLVLIGIVFGFLVALGATRVMATLLYGVGANDLSTYAVVIFLLSTAAVLASYFPARRAMKVDPMVALRYE